jgi:tricarballylate dehydrogenase
MNQRYDVVIVGAGNAAFCAAQAARDLVGRVLVLEKAPPERAGGNSYFTAGAFRTAYGTFETLRSVLPDLPDEQAARIDISPYTEQDYLADLQRLTEGRCDAELAGVLVNDSFDVIRWLHRKGLRWELLFARQSFRTGDRIRFWGGVVHLLGRFPGKRPRRCTTCAWAPTGPATAPTWSGS